MNLIHIRQKHWILALTMKQTKKTFVYPLLSASFKTLRKKAIECDLFPMSCCAMHKVLGYVFKAVPVHTVIIEYFNIKE